jgi:hypothetical protein
LTSITGRYEHQRPHDAGPRTDAGGGGARRADRACAGGSSRLSPAVAARVRARRISGQLTLAVRQFGGKKPSFDLRTTRGFEAGPFRGELISTVVLRHTANGGSSSSSFSSGLPHIPTHKVFREQVTLRYRITSLPSALDVTFAGEPDPFCTALASCGATGTDALSVPRFARTLVVTASRVVPRRVPGSRPVGCGR